ncbi:hypothetical protein P4S72_24340 [Vibrio sp. PP-XX7]
MIDLDEDYKSKLEGYIKKNVKPNINSNSKYELISLATSALEPWYKNKVKENQILLHVSLRDLIPDLLHGVNNIVDDISLATSSNTSLNLYKDKYKNVNNIFKIDSIEKEQIDRNKPSIVASFGMGILDIAAANYIFEVAEKTIC